MTTSETTTMAAKTEIILERYPYRFVQKGLLEEGGAPEEGGHDLLGRAADLAEERRAAADVGVDGDAPAEELGHGAPEGEEFGALEGRGGPDAARRRPPPPPSPTAPRRRGRSKRLQPAGQSRSTLCHRLRRRHQLRRRHPHGAHSPLTQSPAYAASGAQTPD